MKTEVHIVNAFTIDGQGGNPAGVVLDATGLNDKQMQHIAFKVGASETAFILPDKNATHKLRFFTPTTEVSLCAHATIASWHIMHSQGLHKPGRYSQNGLAGIIGVEVNDRGKIFMEQPVQELHDPINVEVIAKALGISTANISKAMTPQICRRNLMIGITTIGGLNSLKPDFDYMEKVSIEHDFIGFHAYVLLDDQDAIASVRNFCPRVGIQEDPATGTANGSFLAYIRHYNKLPVKDIYKIEQGKPMNKPSCIYGTFRADRVWIGGEAKQISKRVIEA